MWPDRMHDKLRFGRSLWVFDMDGTLVTSGVDYARAVLRWGLMFLEEWEHRAPHYEQFVVKFIELLRDIDKERFKTMRAHRERFPGSMVLAYRELCRHFKLEVDPVVEKKTWETGMDILVNEDTYKGRGLIPGAEETMTALPREKRALLFCVTAGDTRVQWMKWRGYKLGRFFPTQTEFRVVRWDKEATLRQLREYFSDIPAFMVGDSISSDIQPAARAGMKPILIPHPSVWDNGELIKELPAGAIQLSKITDIIDRYDELVQPTS